MMPRSTCAPSWPSIRVTPRGDVLARIVTSYGAPDEVADAYRANEATIQKALRTPPPRARSSALGRFFGIYADPRAYLRCFTCCSRW